MKKFFFFFFIICSLNTVLASDSASTASGQVTAHFTNFQMPQHSHYICTANLNCSDATEITILLTIENSPSDYPDIWFWVGDNDCYMGGNGTFEMTVPVSKGVTSVKIQGANNSNARIYMTILKRGNVRPIESTIFGVY